MKVTSKEFDKNQDSQPKGPGLKTAVAVMPLGKALHPHCLVPQRGLKAVSHWSLTHKQPAFLVARSNESKSQVPNMQPNSRCRMSVAFRMQPTLPTSSLGLKNKLQLKEYFAYVG